MITPAASLKITHFPFFIEEIEEPRSNQSREAGSVPPGPAMINEKCQMNNDQGSRFGLGQ